jgi:hypothetical protein
VQPKVKLEDAVVALQALIEQHLRSLMRLAVQFGEQRLGVMRSIISSMRRR